uniref:NADH dehydrogenase [ubiquinone] 1 alpha subcomplex subunit 3 n=1 Tax=Moschus moschiferus TaxID=68415 RepID=A0A8C6MN85_MOSMO
MLCTLLIAAKIRVAERITAFLKNVCAKELVLVASFTSGGLPVVLPTLSPNTKYSVMSNWAIPYKYPVKEILTQATMRMNLEGITLSETG